MTPNDGDLLVIKPENEIWIYKCFDFGNSKDAIVLIRDIKELEDDAGYGLGRFVIMEYEGKTLLGMAPMDKEVFFISEAQLNDKFKYYMTVGEFKEKHGTELV